MMISEKVKDIIEWIVCILIAFVLALVIKHYLITPTIVQQVSMYPTLEHNDRLLLNRWVVTTKGEIKKGDIVTFEAPTKKYIDSSEINKDMPVAVYDREINSIFSKFFYYVLEVNKESYIKRVIGVSGDHVYIDENSNVFVNDEKLEETYIRSGCETKRTGNFYDVVVPEGYVFLMGDNRDHSDDSRRFGCIPLDKIEGRVVCRFWPLDSIGGV